MNTRWTAAAFLLLSIQGCVGNTDVSFEVVALGSTAADEEGETVDLSVPSVAYLFEDQVARETRFREDLAMVCPNGTEMRFSDWYDASEPRLRAAFDSQHVSLARTVEDGTRALLASVDVDCDCVADCQFCPDGAVICTLDCARLDCL